MTIASAIVTKQQQVADAYTACDNKGATMPGTQNLMNLANCIGTIPTGGSSPVITSLSITPTTSAQTIIAPSGTDGYSPITVSAVTASIDNNIQSANIVSGVSILGVSGSATVLNGETQSVSITSTAGNTFTPTSGKNAITSITVTPTNEARTVNPSTSSQSLTVNSGYSGNGTITVNPVTSSIDANITAGNIKKDVTILGVTGSYEGSGGGGAYQLHRVKDNNNNEIGTAFMEFEDANGNKYDVVCLDAQYRSASGQWCSKNSVAVTNMPVYSDLKNSNVWEAKETATQNTQLILDFCNTQSATSTACSYCRSKSFNIGGVTYYGQLPNLVEVWHIARNYNSFDAMDTSASSHSSLNFSSSRGFWSSSQSSISNGWALGSSCNVLTVNKTNRSTFVCPVLEIPK